MPKVKPLGVSMERQINYQICSAVQKREKNDNQTTSTQLYVLKAKARKTHKQMAEMLGISYRSWTNHLADPARIRLGEQRKIQELGRVYGLEITFQ